MTEVHVHKISRRIESTQNNYKVKREREIEREKGGKKKKKEQFLVQAST